MKLYNDAEIWDFRRRHRFCKKGGGGSGTIKGACALKVEYRSYFARMTDERDEGIEQGTINSVRNIMKNLNLSLEKAMDATGIPKSEQPIYREKILKNNI